MKVILSQDVKSQGKKGDMINVSDGYARNYLFPRKLAVEADAAALNAIKGKEEALKRKLEKEKQAASDLAVKLEALVVKIAKSAGSTDSRMFGSVTSKDIADAMLKQHNIEIDKRKIVLDEPIKNYGSYTVEIKLYPEVSGKLNVVVYGG